MHIPTLNEAASSAGASLHDAADHLPGEKSVASAAHSTVAALQSTANYRQDMDWRGMLADLRLLLKRHPGATLLTACAVGFLLARGLARR